MPDREIPEELRAEIERSNQETNHKNRELSPEVLRLVMDKVEDIDKSGTAFHAMNDLRHLKSILQYGILKGGPTEWVKQIKERDPKSVWFNIVGRSNNLEDNNTGSKKEMGRTAFSRLRPFFITFDLSKLNEVDFDFYQKVENDEMPSRHGYMATTEGLNPKKKEYAGTTHPGQMADQGWQKKEDVKVDPSLGFTTKSRIAPRSFKGLIINDGERVNLSIDNQPVKIGDLTDEQRAEVRRKLIEDAINTQLGLFNSKPELLLPVYDVSGELLWPKQMSHEEIKELIDKKVNESEN